MDEVVCGSREKFSGGDGEAERRMRLFGARGSVEHEQVASGFVTQGLWVGNKKVGSQVVGEDRSRLPERETVGKVRRKKSQRQNEGENSPI